MSKTPSITTSLNPAALVTTLALTASIFYPLKTLAQTPTAPSSATSPSSGCLSGYPDGTYRGDAAGGSLRDHRPITRNEFAAGLNACLNQVNKIVPSNKADLATREDFQKLIDRQIELNRKLLQLNDRIGNLPAQK